MKPVLIDREEELEALRGLLASGEPRLALLSGRRRVGKTFLLTHAWPDDHLFLFTAARTTSAINRAQLIRDFASWSGVEMRVEDHPTWRTVFTSLFDVRTSQPLVIVLDEFQFLSDESESIETIASEFNAAWERPRERRQLFVVLCGSSMSILEEMVGGGGPLYGRLAWQHRLQPLNYWYASQMTPFSAERDRAITYGVLGGTPRYLAALDERESLVANLTHLLLPPNGEIRMLIETALDQEAGLREVAKYRAIVRAISDGCTQRNEIAQRTGLPNDNSFRDKLSRLASLGYIELRQNFEARRNDPAQYVIADPAFRFHQRFVEPSLSMLERYAPERVWSTSVAPHLDSYLGLEFERIAVEAYDRRASDAELPLIKQWSRWEGADRTRRSLEIDIVARRDDGGMLTGAVKWSSAPLDAHVHRQHIDMLERVADAGLAWGHEALADNAILYYVSAAGFTDDFKSAVRSCAQRVIAWDIHELYA
ncbi:MAG: ATP-binding protein, partial [bacterium]|nr:ATP-binding protein [Candidatus Kapabacteria bacterium]